MLALKRRVARAFGQYQVGQGLDHFRPAWAGMAHGSDLNLPAWFDPIDNDVALARDPFRSSLYADTHSTLSWKSGLYIWAQTSHPTLSVRIFTHASIEEVNTFTVWLGSPPAFT